MYVLVAEVDFRVPASQSLKEKRSVVTSLVRRIDQMHGVGAAEVGCVDDRQRAVLGVTVVGGDVGRVEAVMDEAERLVWSRPDVEILDFDRSWWEED